MSFGVLEGQDSQAVAVNGTVYVTTSFNRVIAANGATGEILWKYERELPGDVFPKLCCDVVNRGVAVYKNKVYLATLDAHVVALDNQTGAVVWDKKIGDYTYAETFTIMPLAVNGKIVFGTAGAEYGVRGWLAAVNADTGAPVWKTYTIPGPGEPGNETWGGDSWRTGSGATWLTGSYDPELDMLYWGIGNPGPDWNGDVRPGDNLYTSGMMALDAETAAVKLIAWSLWATEESSAARLPSGVPIGRAVCISPRSINTEITSGPESRSGSRSAACGATATGKVRPSLRLSADRRVR